jgi:hypothetical protein
VVFLVQGSKTLFPPLQADGCAKGFIPVYATVSRRVGPNYGLKQMGYAYGKVALLPFGAWSALKPPGTSNQAGARPAIVPDNWTEKAIRKNNGRIYIDPNNPHNRVRVMDDGYMKVQKNGQCLDVNGNEVPSDSPAAHIPVNTPMKSPFVDSPVGDIPIVE